MPTTIAAQPHEFTLTAARCAPLIIDMQRDFLEPGGFGIMLGNDVSLLIINDAALPSPDPGVFIEPD